MRILKRSYFSPRNICQRYLAILSSPIWLHLPALPASHRYPPVIMKAAAPTSLLVQSRTETIIKRERLKIRPDEEKSKSIKKAKVAFDNSMDLHIYTVRESPTDQIDLQDRLFSDVMSSTLTDGNLFSMDPVPYRTPHCGCSQCYTRHKEVHFLVSDYTSVIQPVYVWRDHHI